MRESVEEATESTTLRSKAVSGIAWTGGTQVIRQLVQVGSFLVLGRLLGPSEFGLIAMAMFFIGIGQLIADFGIGSAIVQAESPDQVQLSSCFWLNLLLACTICGTSFAIAPLVGRFYSRPDVVPVLQVLSLTLLLNALQTVPGTLLYRRMRFAILTLVPLCASITAAAVAITLAYFGAGVWALVAQPLVGTMVTLPIFVISQGWWPTFEFSWRRVAPLVRFSSALFASRLLDYAQRSADSVLIGRYLGSVALGLYAGAAQIMVYPMQQVSSVFARAMFPVLVRLRDDLPRLRNAYLKEVASIALLTFPLMGGMFILADDFVNVVFGPKWADMVPVLRILVWVGMIQSVTTTTGTLYECTGNAALALKVTFVKTLALVGMAAGLRWGIVGVAVGFTVASFLTSYYVCILAFRLIRLDFRSFFAVLSGPFLATMAMMAALQLGGSLASNWVAAPRLFAGVGLGAVVYLGATMLFNRALLLEVLATIRSLGRL